MPITVSTTFDVEDQTALSIAATAVVLPPVGLGTGGRGRLVHPTLGVYDYIHTPTETEGLDGDVIFGPIWSHTPTLEGAVNTNWPGYIQDGKVIERWINGDTGGEIEHLRALFSFFAEAPEDSSVSPVVWSPNYATTLSYNVVLVNLTAGGASYRLDRRLLSFGYAPSPVELELRVLGYAD